ncbi:MAG TPA: hypothetical protein GX016_10060 [Firmicutes bacterium]|nr:hypothetical protein [Bacillota bacterium]
MRKSILIGLLVLSLAGLLVVGGTAAWFGSTPESKTNQFTAGTVVIEVEESFTPPTAWQPGQTATKEVSVKSIGTKGVYVRVALTPVWSDPSLPIDNVILNLSNGNWVHHTDGWYYYKFILYQGEVTELLLASVTLDPATTGEEYQGETLDIVVSAEAVQASHNAYQTVWGLISLPPGVQPWSP